MGECRGGVWHWWMDTRIWIAVIAILVLFGVGIIIVNATAEQIGKLATDSFVVAEKQVVDVTRNYFFFEVKIGTVFLLIDGEGHYASVCQATYDYYKVGDLYPNTEPQIMIG